MTPKRVRVVSDLKNGTLIYHEGCCYMVYDSRDVSLYDYRLKCTTSGKILMADKVYLKRHLDGSLDMGKFYYRLTDGGQYVGQLKLINEVRDWFY